MTGAAFQTGVQELKRKPGSVVIEVFSGGFAGQRLVLAAMIGVTVDAVLVGNGCMESDSHVDALCNPGVAIETLLVGNAGEGHVTLLAIACDFRMPGADRSGGHERTPGPLSRVCLADETNPNREEDEDRPGKPKSRRARERSREAVRGEAVRGEAVRGEALHQFRRSQRVPS